MQKLPFTLFSAGFIIAIICICYWCIIPSEVNNIVEKEIFLRNGTVLWDSFTTEQTTMLNVYVFNVTNPKEIENGEDPLLIELGPYVYRVISLNRIVDENIDNDTLKYTETNTYHFDEKLSNGTEDDIVTVLSLECISVAQHLDEFSSTLRWFAAIYLSKFKSTVFEQHSVGEYLFKGSFLPIIDEIQTLTGQDLVPNATFGILYGRNGTESKMKEIYRGIKDPSTLGETISYGGKQELNFWSDAYCNRINGTAGSFFPPHVTKERRLDIFNQDFCRTASFIFKKELTVKGIPAYRFATFPEFLASGKNNPNNECFCTVKNK